MSFPTRMLACASAIALTLPAAAQDTAMPDVSDSAAWADVIEPNIRVIQRDGQGNVVYDSGGGQGQDVARQIREADAPTIGATDARDMGGNEIVSLRWAPSPRRADLAASPQPSRTQDSGMQGQGSGMQGMMADGRNAAGGQQMDSDMMAQVDDAPAPQTDGDYGMGATFVTPSGVEIDMESFARELFEQGYRRGYVSGLTEMRTRAVRQMQGQQARFDRYRTMMERRAAMQSEEMQDALDGETGARMQRMRDGSTVITLPPGMSPQRIWSGVTPNAN